jgi:hypothetical protein
MKKLVLLTMLSVSYIFANTQGNDMDLLSVVTEGKIKGLQYELNKESMDNIKGGFTYIPASVRQMQANSFINSMLSSNTPKVTTGNTTRGYADLAYQNRLKQQNASVGSSGNIVTSTQSMSYTDMLFRSRYLTR